MTERVMPRIIVTDDFKGFVSSEPDPTAYAYALAIAEAKIRRLQEELDLANDKFSRLSWKYDDRQQGSA